MCIRDSSSELQILLSPSHSFPQQHKHISHHTTHFHRFLSSLFSHNEQIKFALSKYIHHLSPLLKKERVGRVTEGEFRSGRGCVDQIFTLKQMTEIMREKNNKLYL